MRRRIGRKAGRFRLKVDHRFCNAVSRFADRDHRRSDAIARVDTGFDLFTFGSICFAETRIGLPNVR